jgi:hypothetical protein
VTTGVVWDLMAWRLVYLSKRQNKTSPNTTLCVHFIHDLPLYLACPHVLSLVGELTAGDGWGLSNPV